ncbi:elongation factor P 5-aminopentanone reductase [Massiliimalia massiliensis]|jgi:3-oxoacyl-[acyl-carrier protein] reductase|uniref:elongation factor P 5-aminopentanone reductase n=1 Tax=Massiliimalia massiliensis TaxID=1852384 RepID=UPI0009863363|nr:3-oxoacyl-ACP reductase FabG [Massiliimalia massiliensis]
MKNQTVLITGASRGIGRAAALLFAENGYRIAANYRQSAEEIRRLEEEISAFGVPFLPLQADVSDPEAVEQMAEKAQRQFGGIDVLVNNAGISLIGLLQDTTAEDWNRIFGVNVNGAFYAAKAVLPGMIRRQMGRIINISSMWGVAGASCEVAYSASKAALIGFTKALAKEAGPSHITVNCIAPGVVMTDMNRELAASALEELREETPLGVIGTPEDIARAILFLASEEAGFITGQVLNVNGGIVI